MLFACVSAGTNKDNYCGVLTYQKRGDACHLLLTLTNVRTVPAFVQDLDCLPRDLH